MNNIILDELKSKIEEFEQKIGKKISISPTKIITLTSCKRKYLKDVLEPIYIATPSAVTGSAWHFMAKNITDYIDANFEKLIGSDQITLFKTLKSVATDAISKFWKSEASEDEKNCFSDLGEFLEYQRNNEKWTDEYLRRLSYKLEELSKIGNPKDKWTKAQIVPIFSEKKIRIDKLRFTGILDKMSKISPKSENYLITDYKTGKPPVYGVWDDVELQLLMYKYLAITENLIPADAKVHGSIYYVRLQEERFVPLPSVKKTNELVEDMLIKAWTTLFSNDDTSTPGKYCQWCPYECIHNPNSTDVSPSGDK